MRSFQRGSGAEESRSSLLSWSKVICLELSVIYRSKTRPLLGLRPRHQSRYSCAKSIVLESGPSKKVHGVSRVPIPQTPVTSSNIA